MASRLVSYRHITLFSCPSLFHHIFNGRGRPIQSCICAYKPLSRELYRYYQFIIGKNFQGIRCNSNNAIDKLVTEIDNKEIIFDETEKNRTNSDISTLCLPDSLVLIREITLSNILSFRNVDQPPWNFQALVVELSIIWLDERQKFAMLKYIGDAYIRIVVAELLKLEKSNWKLISRNCEKFIVNGGVLLSIFDEYVAPFLTIPKFRWNLWNSHTRCDFVEALIALSEEKNSDVSFFIYSRLSVFENSKPNVPS